MDNYKAKQLEQILVGQNFLAYNIEKLLNNGKSAAVFKAIDKEGNTFAIKIFDNDLVERFGHEIQERRIEQEISLKGHDIPNLVKIIDGGKTQLESYEYYYIVMQYISGQNLKQYISTATYDNKFLQKVVETIYRVTESLLEIGIVHRDIKPENIMIDDLNEIILMDLGVLKLIGVKSFSDQEEKQFVGTLRYAPPEFLTREEEDSIFGWKSVNLYQIGAVLHDLIMKEEIFGNITPYSNLVISIKEDAPQITSSTLPYVTVQLSRDLLVKDWRKRLSITSNDRIQEFFTKDPNDKSSIEKELEDIFSLTSENKAKFEEIEKINRSNNEKAKRRADISIQLENVIDQCVKDLILKGLFNKSRRSGAFLFNIDKTLQTPHAIKNFLYFIEGDISKGFPKPLFLLVRMRNDENSLAEISLLAMFLSPKIRFDFSNPLNMFSQIGQEQNPGLKNAIVNLNTYDAFNGTVGFDDQFKETLTLEMIKLIKVALKGVASEVKAELEQREQFAKDNMRASFSRVSSKTQMFYKIE